MIYCVIPPELADDLFDKLVEYYEDNPNVQVIVDRRGYEQQPRSPKTKKRGERRRPRIPGTFPDIEAH